MSKKIEVGQSMQDIARLCLMSEISLNCSTSGGEDSGDAEEDSL